MAEPVLKVDATGAAGASLAVNVDGLNERQRDAFGADLAATPQTPQAQWGGVVGLGLTEMGEAGSRAAVYGSSVDHAIGVHLDAIGSVADVRRLEATRSRVVATLTGVGGVTVPALSRAKTADGDEFETTEDVTLLSSGVDVVMQAVESGPVEAAAAALNRIVTGIEGWETVTNAAAAVPGRARQDDDTYKRLYRARAAHSSVSPLDGLRAAITEAGASRRVVVDNRTNAPVVKQLWTLPPHSVFAIVAGGLDTDIHRAVENHRGMGAATLTAIVGGAPPAGGLAGLSSPYEIAWRGTTATVADSAWGAASTNAEYAAAITTAIDGDVTVAWTGHRFIGQYEWAPEDTTAAFDDGDMATALGLDPDAATEAPGPFVRPTARPLTVSFTLTRLAGFPGDGLERVRSSVLARVGGMDAIADRDLTDAAREDIRDQLDRLGASAGYAIGAELWANDILGAAERIPGTRVTLLSVQAGGVDVSGVAVSLDNRWTLSASDMTITIP